jgi:MoaA/NifB/PqqE/SkfB family radical SAM enzyme
VENNIDISNNNNGQLDKQKNSYTINGEYKEVQFLSDIGLVTTYHCQAACPHCIVEASPKRKEYIPLADACSWLEQISGYNDRQIKAVALTGGEPFSNLQYLTSIVDKASSMGLLLTAVSNAYWATSYEAP